MGAACCQQEGAGGDGDVERMRSEVKIHGMTVSPNAMAPILLVKYLSRGEMELCDLMKGQNKSEEFLKMNPFHTIPTMQVVKDNFALGESQAIMRYLARMYAKELYPEVEDPKLAARIDWCLDALGTTVYSAWAERAYPVMGFAPEPKDKAAANAKLKEVLDMFCATFVGSSKLLCGDQLTLADFRALPLLFVLNQPAISSKAGIKLSERLKKYVNDATQAIGAVAGMLQSAQGYSLAEYLSSKEPGLPNFEGAPTVCGEQKSPCEIKSGRPPENETGAKIWGMTISANTCSALLFAKAEGLGDLKECDLMKGDHMKPEFLAKNPFHQIPVYEGSDGFCLGESNAMLRYMANNYRRGFYPDDVQERGRIDWAMDVIASSMYKKLAYPIFYPVFGFAEAPADQEAANTAGRTILEEYQQTFLGNGRFVLGQKVSIAEYKILPFLHCLAQPAVVGRTRFELPARIAKYMEDILEEIPESCDELLQAIRNYAESKQ